MKNIAIIALCLTCSASSLSFADETLSGDTSVSQPVKIINPSFLSDPATIKFIEERKKNSKSSEEAIKDLGMTLEEFKNLPRREVTEAEIKARMGAAEKAKADPNEGARGNSLGDFFGSPQGNSNNFNYSNAFYGDILLVHDGWVPWGYFRHAGMYDNDFRATDRLTIYTSQPGVGVSRVSEDVFRNHYDVQSGFWDPDSWPAGYNATVYAYIQSDVQPKPYNYAIWNKWDTTKFYCSSLVWRAYYNNGVDIDFDGGGAVLPDDIAADADVDWFQTAY